MKNWRRVLSWKQVPRELKVGDKVRIVASIELLSGIDIEEDLSGCYGYIAKIESRSNWRGADVNPTVEFNYFGDIGVQGEDHEGSFFNYLFPYSHWRDFLEVVI